MAPQSLPSVSSVNYQRDRTWETIMLHRRFKSSSGCSTTLVPFHAEFKPKRYPFFTGRLKVLINYGLGPPWRWRARWGCISIKPLVAHGFSRISGSPGSRGRDTRGPEAVEHAMRTAATASQPTQLRRGTPRRAPWLTSPGLGSIPGQRAAAGVSIIGLGFFSLYSRRGLEEVIFRNIY